MNKYYITLYILDIAVGKSAYQQPELSDPSFHPASNALSGDDKCTDDYSQTGIDGAVFSWWSVYLGGTCTVTSVSVAAKGINKLYQAFSLSLLKR